MQDEPSAFSVSCQMVIDLTLQCNMDLDGFLRYLSEGYRVISDYEDVVLHCVGGCSMTHIGYMKMSFTSQFEEI